MFKKTRIKIVATIMTILVLLLVGTLCLIYFTSYIDTYNRNQQLLERYVESYTQWDESEVDDSEPNYEGQNDWQQNFRPGRGYYGGQSFRPNDTQSVRQNNIFWLSTFYAVSFSDDGDLLRIDDIDNIYTEEELTAFALAAIEKGDEHGTISGLIYRMARADGYTLVVFMDNTIVAERQTTLFRYTLIFGSAAIVVIFFISLYLSRKIVQPIEQSYKKQKQFISDAGHELKTPVSVVGTNAELLEREIGENRWLSNIQYENGKMALLIKQLMELAKTEHITTEKAQVDLSRIVMGESLTFESVTFDKGMQLDTFVDEEVFVYGNAEQLSRLVSILLDNAIDHSAAQGTVTVDLSVAHGKARLSVTNEGDEIPEAERSLIFERFYRADASRTGEDDHYGLGLAIAKSIVTAHHGDIQVSCEQGEVTFTVTLPNKK